MLKEKLVVTFDDGREIVVPYGTKAIDAIKMVEDDTDYILAVVVNNEVKFQEFELKRDSQIGFVKIDSDDGYRVYSKSLKFVLYMALTELYGNKKVDFLSTINRNQYFVVNDLELTEDVIAKLKEKMAEIIDADYPITKEAMSVDEAIEYYKLSNDTDKINNMANRLKSYTNMYFCNGYYNNFYGVLVPHTGLLDVFDLISFRNGAMLVMKDKDGNLSEVKDSNLIDIVELFGGLKVPKQFLGFTDDAAGFSGGTSLTKLDARYARTIKRIQNAYVQGITDLLNLFALDKGLDGYVNNFKVRMVSPATTEDAERDETMGIRLDLISSFIELLGDSYTDETKKKVFEYFVNIYLSDNELSDILEEDKGTQEEDEFADEAMEEDGFGTSSGHSMSSDMGGDMLGDFRGGGEPSGPPEDFGGENTGFEDTGVEETVEFGSFEDEGEF